MIEDRRGRISKHAENLMEELRASHKRPCRELLDFQDILDSNGIKYLRNDNTVVGIFRVQGKIVREDGFCIPFSVIWGYGTYGDEQELLEVMVGNREPFGWLTAAEAFEEIRRAK